MIIQPTISIVGFGRFGKVLYKLLSNEFLITLFQRNQIRSSDIFASTRIAKSIREIYSSDVIFFAVPISSFEKVIMSHKQFFRSEHLLIDVLSVKMHPKNVFTKHLMGTGTRALLTHPMFGPDSSQNGFVDLPIIIDQFTAKDVELRYWEKFFTNKQLRIINMSAEQHDKLTASSQCLTHLIGRLVEKHNLQPTTIDTLGTKKLHEIKKLSCNDTWELFEDLQRYNPYASAMRSKISSNLNLLNQKLSTINNKVY